MTAQPETAAPETGTEARPVLALAFAVLFVSGAAIVTRFTTGAPLSVAGWRLGLAAIALLCWPQARSGWRGLSMQDLWRVAGAAACLAIHFGAWIASLRLVPVAVSVVLVSTHPLFVLAARRAIGERPRRHEGLGVLIAVAGVAVMQPWSANAPPGFVLGVLFSLTGAAGLAAYLLIGAEVRPRLGTPSYLLLVYGLAALALFSFLSGLGGGAAPPSSKEFLLYALLALVPTLGGHGLFAYAIGHLRPVSVSVAFLAEPVAATLIAIPVFHEMPGVHALAGGGLVLTGLALVVGRHG